MMSRFKKHFALIAVLMVLMCAIAVPMIAMAESEFGDWEKFYPYNKSIMQRHAHSRVLMRLPVMREAENYTSGVACVQSILRYKKYELDIREGNLAYALGANEEYGTRADKMAGYLNAVRYGEDEERCFNAGVEEKMTVGDLLDELDKGHPVICAIQAWNWDENEEYSMDLDYSNEWECGHWAVAIGYNKDNVFFMDPATAGNYTYIPKNKLVQRWHDYYIDESNQRCDIMQCGIVVELCGDEQPDGERYKDAFFGLM